MSRVAQVYRSRDKKLGYIKGDHDMEFRAWILGVVRIAQIYLGNDLWSSNNEGTYGMQFRDVNYRCVGYWSLRSSFVNEISSDSVLAKKSPVLGHVQFNIFSGL